ncbi:MAG: Hint domain-containing protein [Paracoccaceae bacterium]
MPTLFLYELSSFTTPAPMEGNGAGGPIGTLPFTITTGPTLSLIAIEVTDPDNIISENDSDSQVLTFETTVNGVTYPAGTQIRGDYYLAENDDETGQRIISISIGGSNSGADTSVGIASTVPLEPNESYVFDFESNVNPDFTPSATPQFYMDFVCFADGTQIMTRNGQVAVEKLQIGDDVMTMDSGYQPIRWIGSRTLDAIDLAVNPNLRPIRIKAGALGAGLPEQDLFVSPQHRIFVRSAIAQRMFGTSEILIPAKKLLDIVGIDVDQGAQSVTYTHFLFEKHEIVFSNKAPTESLFTGKEALKSVSAAARQEIMEIFPEIASPDFSPIPARPIPEKGKTMHKFADRVKKNGRYIVERMM